jgi:mono/diheme cytochrome c family protein
MLPFHPSGLKRLANPYDKAEPLDQRAKAWLHTNCATCHVEAGGGNAQFKLDIDTPWGQMRLIDVKPQHQSFNLPEARLIAPGSPERSILIHRIGARGHNSGQMPPISSSLPDTAGVALMTEWCRSLKKTEAGKP